MNISYFSKFKTKTQKLIKTNKNVCIINYIKIVNGVKWKIENLLVNFDSEDVRLNFQNLISNELNSCKFELLFHFYLK